MWAKLVEFFISKILFTAIEKLAVMLPEIFIRWKKQAEKEKAQREAKENLDKVKSNPEADIDEIAKANKDFINSGN